MPGPQNSSSGRLISLGFKKATGEGLTDDEQKEYQTLQSQDAMARRMAQAPAPAGG